MKNSTKIIVFFSILISSIGFSQMQPCNGSGFAGAYPCNDYDLMSNISIETLTGVTGAEGSDVWGWTDPSNGKEYALIATTHNTVFVDVSSPINPIILGRIETETSSNVWRDVKIYNNHAFIVADNVGAHGLQVFDLTKLRDGVDSDLTYTLTDNDYIVYNGIGSCHNIVINESEAMAYVVGCDNASGGPVFIDISSPLSPNIIGTYPDDGYTHDAQVVTYNGPDTSPDPNTTSIPSYVGREILIASNGSFGGSDKLVIVDVTDKNSPFKIGEIAYSQPGYAHQGWFTDDHRYFIMGDETDEQSYGMNTRTLIFDLSNLDLPVLHGTYSGPSAAIDHNGYVKGDEFFMANYRAGMRVLHVPTLLSANNTNSEIGFFDTYPNDDNTAFNGAWSIYPYFDSGNILISDIERGLFVVRKSGTLSTTDIVLNDTFTISPNPSNHNPTIKAKSNQRIEMIEVYNVLGQKTFSKDNINLEEYVLPTDDFASGMYLVKINSTITKKLILK